MKVKYDLIDVICMCLTFYEFSNVPHMVFLTFKYAVLLILFVKYFRNYNEIKLTMLIATMYSVIVVFSTMINNMPFNTLVASIMHGFQIIDLFLVTYALIKKYTVKQYSKWLFWILFSLCVLSDILMIFVEYDFSNPGERYLIGSKFVIAYAHCFVCTLGFVYVNNQNKNIRYLGGKIKINGINKNIWMYLFGIYSFFICMRVGCSTGMVIMCVLILLLAIPNEIKKHIFSTKIMILFVIIVNALMFGTYNLLNNQNVQYFIQNILGKTSNLTGRVQIWNIIFEFIEEKKILGYGYYSDIIENVLGYGNPQNGILKILIDTGFIGLILYALLIWKSFRCINNEKLKLLYPIMAFMYAMFVASFVEINLNHMVVFLAMAISAGYVENRK